ncbi:phenoloxidase 1 [Anabrus simplex]|uniref:phenoloxidase 1 n=1 Tax=Anabrus simplex TaxID=316456 RepID=UPI0035A386E1
MYSVQRLAEMHFMMYGKADGNAALARRLYQERYPHRRCPDVRFHRRLREHGKFHSPGLGRGRPRSTTSAVEEEILDAVDTTPSISTRRIGLKVNVPHTIVWKLLKEYQIYSYHLQRVQALSPADYPARVRFCEWFLQQCGAKTRLRSRTTTCMGAGAPMQRDPLLDRSNLQYLFEHPGEPIFQHRGSEGHIIFDIPAEYYSSRYLPMATELMNRFGPTSMPNATAIRVPRIEIPDLSFPMELGRREPFSPFIPYHRQMAHRLVEVFMGMRTYADFVSLLVFCHEHINPGMYQYAMSIAIFHRNDTGGAIVPSIANVFPDKFVDGAVFSRCREEANMVPVENRIPIEIPQDYTATNVEIEHRLAYFREDIGVNLHHWHWHLVYPNVGPREIVSKDRRGELFYYMHHYIIAKYNFERFSNHLPRVNRFVDWREPIEEGYFPKLDSLVSSRVWPARHAFAKLSDIDRPLQQITFDIQDLERWRDRIFEAIHTGRIINERGESVPLTERDGIDILGNILESSILTPNRNLYGDLHNLVHVALSYIHDPDHRHLENLGVMGDSTTAMRDPVFYRWHAFVDDIFEEFKRTLPRYTVDQLNFSGVRVTNIEVLQRGGGRNVFNTFWQKSDLDLSRGMDFMPRGPVYVRVTHLQHVPFTYHIQVENSGQARRGTVRIFMAPKLDERGVPFVFRDHRLFFAELDKFQIQLRSGRNVIERQSNQSSVTIPYERTFRDLDTNRPAGGAALEQFNYCGCGWPQHMLIPKGTPEGLPAVLFVIVSDYTGDRVEQSGPPNQCSDGHSLCGIRGQLYPDQRSMGYPFDRLPRAGVGTLQQFLTPNMNFTDVSIFFKDTVVIANNTRRQEPIRQTATKRPRL